MGFAGRRQLKSAFLRAWECSGQRNEAGLQDRAVAGQELDLVHDAGGGDQLIGRVADEGVDQDVSIKIQHWPARRTPCS